jgi:hypothetical protein
MFLQDCGNAIWSLKGPKGPNLFVLVTLFRHKISITLQRMQAFSISSQMVTIGLTTSQLPHVGSRFLTWRITADLL